MKRLGRFLLIIALLALPLRGMAAVWVPQFVGAAAEMSHAGCHEGMQEDADDRLAYSSCGHCAACPIGAPALPGSLATVFAIPANAVSIPFLDRRVQVYVPERLDRPPLSL